MCGMMTIVMMMVIIGMMIMMKINTMTHIGQYLGLAMILMSIEGLDTQEIPQRDDIKALFYPGDLCLEVLPSL